LQEVVIPVIRVGKQRETDVGQVDVQIFVSGRSLISSGQTAVTLYQTQPVSEKMRPRELLAGIYAADGTLISDEYSLIFDFRSDNAHRQGTGQQDAQNSRPYRCRSQHDVHVSPLVRIDVLRACPFRLPVATGRSASGAVRFGSRSS